MENQTEMHSKARRKSLEPGLKLRDEDKTSLIPVVPVNDHKPLPKPSWIRVRAARNPGKVGRIKSILRKHKLFSVCEEASCPNLSECFGGGTATFMIMGEICTRRCPFCDVAHGRPLPLDKDEPRHLAEAIAEMELRYVVVTSVDRDDLLDGGAAHFAECIKAIKELSPDIKVEVLVPDFRGRIEPVMKILRETPPDIFNHNLETVQRLYKEARPGSDYKWSLNLLKRFGREVPSTKTKSGIMVGLGETLDEIREVMRDMREHEIRMVTIGQYLQPSKSHLAVKRFITPDEFKELEDYGYELGFDNVASGPLVRSSYHADQQAKI